MKHTVQAIHASTQSFTEIQEIIEDVVLFSNGHAALVIEVSATNFALLSKDEQDARIGAYASFLNSLTFQIEILITNKRVDITSYLMLLDIEIHKKSNNPTALAYMQHYKTFVEQLVKQNTVLDKRFYIVIPYSTSETSVEQTLTHRGAVTTNDFFQTAKATLHTKADGIRNQLSRINLPNKILEQDDLIRLFSESYGQEVNNQHNLARDLNSTVVKQG